MDPDLENADSEIIVPQSHPGSLEGVLESPDLEIRPEQSEWGVSLNRFDSRVPETEEAHWALSQIRLPYISAETLGLSKPSGG